jgi:UTP--glucose-1-phosphate uridylyltransferase
MQDIGAPSGPGGSDFADYYPGDAYYDVAALDVYGDGYSNTSYYSAMLALAKTQPFYGLKFDGRSYDCGSKIGFLTANVAYALDRPDLAPEFRSELKRILGEK